MAARDLYHYCVRTALESDGWTITDDPLRIKVGLRQALVDIGAERLLSAERGEQKIAVEIKSFLSPSRVKDLEMALGQFILYEDILARTHPERLLYNWDQAGGIKLAVFSLSFDPSYLFLFVFHEGSL